MPPRPRNSITAERVRELLIYDPESGKFAWRFWRSGLKHGSLPGNVRKDGYRQIRLDGQRYLEHRLAWLYVTGEWPEEWVDHIDHDHSNNRFSNLREASHSENMANKRVNKNSGTGIKGVHQRGDRFLVKILINGERRYLGSFSTKEHAKFIYDCAAFIWCGEFAS